jgi:large subunit ribosomal protein L24
MRRIRSGDEVIVIAGRDKGRRGKVLRMVDDQRVMVEGINLVKRHTRPNPTRNQPGGIIEKEASIHVSNVMLYNPITEKGDRIGFKTLDDGRKVRYFKSNNEVVDG